MNKDPIENTSTDHGKRCRSLKRSKEQRLRNKWAHQEKTHDKFMNYHLDESNCCTHSLGILNKKEFNRLKDNLIILSNPNIIDGNKISRKIYYTIKSVGSNVKIAKDGPNLWIKFRETKRRFVMVVIQEKEMMEDLRITKFDMINSKKFNKSKNERNDYLILMQCGDYFNNMVHKGEQFSLDDLTDIKSVVPNQISKEKHFGSVGDVYSIGYSAKYSIKNELSFDRFVTSKFMSIRTLYFHKFPHFID